MNQQEIAALTRLLGRAARKGASAFSAVRLMVSAIRAINQRGDKTVGKNLLAVVMRSDVAAAPSVQVLIGGGAGMYIGDGDPDFKNSLTYSRLTSPTDSLTEIFTLLISQVKARL